MPRRKKPMGDFTEKRPSTASFPKTVEFEITAENGRRVKLSIDGKTLKLLDVTDAKTGKKVDVPSYPAALSAGFLAPHGFAVAPLLRIP